MDYVDYDAALYEWRQARRQLRRVDRWRVVWATRRSHPAIQAPLAGAQLTYARYLQAAAWRALYRRRGVRVGLAALFGVFAAGYAAIAATQSQLRIIDSVGAAGFTGLAVVQLTEPRSDKRQIERMARLRTEIQRAPEMPPDGR